VLFFRQMGMWGMALVEGVVCGAAPVGERPVN
jgi:hypothetical protein